MSLNTFLSLGGTNHNTMAISRGASPYRGNTNAYSSHHYH